MNACQKHRLMHLRFKVDSPTNSEIVGFFFRSIGPLSDGRIGVTVGDKHYAIQRWGYLDSMAGMFRAFRKFKANKTA